MFAMTRDLRLGYLPLLLSISYLSFTAVLALLDMQAPFRPEYPFALQVPVRLFGFVAAAYLCLVIGYWSNTHKRWWDAGNSNNLGRELSAVNLLIVLGSIHMCVEGIGRLRYGGYELDSNVITQLTPGETYRELHSKVTEESIVLQLTNLTAFLPICAMPLTAMLWNRLPTLSRCMFVVGLTVFLVGYFGAGTNRGLLLVALYVSVGRLVAVCADRWRQGHQRLYLSSAKGIVVLGVSLGVMFVFAFGYLMTARASASVVSSYGYTPLGALIGGKGAFTLHTLSSYLSQGYCGLSYNLIDPFPNTGGWTWGAGNSMAAMGYLNRYLSIDLLPYHYAYVVEQTYGYPMGVHWSTVFPWIASDITFIGCLPFMFFAGRFFALCWWESVVRQRLSSVVMLAQMALFIAFIPANNQVVQGNGSFIGFMCAAFWWIYDHAKSQPGSHL